MFSESSNGMNFSLVIAKNLNLYKIMDSIQQSNNISQTNQNPIDVELREVNENLCGTSLHPWEYRKVFNIILAAMGDNLTSREREFLKKVRNGERVSDIAISDNLSVERVRQIINAAYVKIAEFNPLEKIMEENAKLKSENELLRQRNINLKAGWSFCLNMISRENEKRQEIVDRFGDKEQFERTIRLLNTKISDTELSRRGRKACYFADIETVEELVREGIPSLSECKNVGKKTIKEITLFLEEYHLEWGMDIDELRAIGSMAFNVYEQNNTSLLK